MKNHILFITILFSSIAATAQKISATVDRDNILIGEQIKLRLQANFSKGEQLSWFDNLDSIPHFEVIEKSGIDTVNAGDGFALSQDLTITSWDSGKVFLQPFVMGQWQTKPISINVAYSPHPFDTTKPYHDIKPILDVKSPIESNWYWYLIFALALLGLFLLFFPKSKKKAKGEFVPDEGAYKKALRKLDKLQSAKDVDPKVFYTELIQVFREYLHRRKNIYSFSKTTDDLSFQMQQLNMDREHYAELVQTLRLSDLVKFARYRPSGSEDETSVEIIRQSIVAIEKVPHAV